MGGIFSSPTPPASPPLEPTVDPAEEARKAREKIIERNKRGRAGLIQTANTGILAPKDDAAINSQKTLLGE